jgi:shikimate dehydrogenase
LFRQNGINADYQNFEIDDISQLPDIISNNPNLCGLNVTIPYKVDVIQYMDRLDDTARQIGAVNVIKILRTEDKVELIGYNTDAIGFMESIRPIVGDRKKALILGTGGSAKAVKYGLDQLGIESRFVSRNTSFDILGYYELSPSIIEDSKIIVNCTPVGMWPNTSDYPAIPYGDLTSDHLLYDVIYNPEETMFMQKGKYYGATVKNGYEMWQLQADATWNIWNE